MPTATTNANPETARGPRQRALKRQHKEPWCIAYRQIAIQGLGFRKFKLVGNFGFIEFGVTVIL